MVAKAEEEPPMLEEARTKQPDEIYCSNCGSLTKMGAQFCSHCGARMGSGSAEAQADRGTAPGQAAAPARTAPVSAEEFNNKGQRLEIEGKLDEALTAFGEAIMLAPSYANAYLNRAEVLEKLGRVSEAQADRQTARALTAAGARTGPASAVGEPAARAAAIEASMEERDVVGAGRYILNFLLLGFIGLGLTYFLRYQGWLATWICLAVFVVVVILIVAASG
jgi:tetratricopeptide (TPR) repeat protein